MIDVSTPAKLRDAVQAIWHVVMGNGSPSVDKRFTEVRQEAANNAREMSDFKEHRAETCPVVKRMEKAMTDHVKEHHQAENLNVATIGLVINSIGILVLIVLHFV